MNDCEPIYLGNVEIEHMHGQRRILQHAYAEPRKRHLFGLYGACCGVVYFSTSDGLIEAVRDPAKPGNRPRLWRLTAQSLAWVRGELGLRGPGKLSEWVRPRQAQTLGPPDDPRQGSLF